MLVLSLCLLPWAAAQGSVHASVHASLDREQLVLGEVATLTIRAAQADSGPDYAPLERDFLIHSPNLRRYSEMINGRFSTRVEYVLAIEPRRAGQLQVPALRVGNHYTAPLLLQVVDAAVAGRNGQGSAPPLTFIQTRLDTDSPWVHQSVGVVVALYYATQLASGELIQQAPEHAGLQRFGQDSVSQAMVDGRHYNVVERRYLLLPERSGPLQLPPARFRGRAVGGGRGHLLSAEQSPAVRIDVQPRPDNAPDPWLPAHAVSLEWQVVPDRLEAGRGTELVLYAQLDGATRAQLDTLPLPAAGPGYQLYPQATEVEETFHADRPQLVLRRRVVLVADSPGVLQLPALELPWWQVDQGRLRKAVQPAIQFEVVAAATGDGHAGSLPQAAPSAGANALPARSLPGGGNSTRWWYAGAATAMVLGLLLLLQQRRRAGSVAAMALPAASGRPSLLQLQAQLDQGGLQDIIDTLAAMVGVDAGPALLAALQQPEQRQALIQAEQAWWGAGKGDRVAARAALRRAFAGGPVYTQPAPAAGKDDPLPPLYRRP